MIKVLIVDDSPTERACLRRAFERDPQLLVVGDAPDSKTALELIDRLDPDIITMDVFLGAENGLKLTSTIMATAPRPIVVITGVESPSAKIVYDAMVRGAVEVVAKPQSIGTPEFDATAKQLCRLLRTLATVPTVSVRRNAAQKSEPQSASSSAVAVAYPATSVAPTLRRSPTLVLIGASTGGPPLVAELLSKLARPLKVPIVIAQHMSVGFGSGFAKWLSDTTGHAVTIVVNATAIENRVYLAPDNRSLRLVGPTLLTASEDVGMAGTSIDLLFSSAAELVGPTVLAFLLTGMGRDGASGLSELYKRKAYTVVQEPATCAVDSMPRAALDLGAVSAVLRVDQMAALIGQMTR